jgi:hypothetical protein
VAEDVASELYFVRVVSGEEFETQNVSLVK